MSQVDTHYVTYEEIGAKVCCPHCHKYFTTKGSYYNHVSKHCAVLKEQRLFEKFSKMLDQRDAIQAQKDAVQAQKDAVQAQEIIKIHEKLSTIPLVPYIDSSTHNQNLSILCLGSQDNLLDMLVSQEDLPKALTYIKGCALSRLAGDCRILERLYKLETEQAAIKLVNKTKNKFVYYDERQRRTVESNSGIMAKKLAGILQRSYLKGMESFGTDILGNDKDLIPLKIRSQLPKLDPYDIQIWNAHIHELADEKYQKKILNNLKIPIEKKRE